MMAMRRSLNVKTGTNMKNGSVEYYCETWSKSRTCVAIMRCHDGLDIINQNHDLPDTCYDVCIRLLLWRSVAEEIKRVD